jgi:hypothetical protein
MLADFPVDSWKAFRFILLFCSPMPRSYFNSLSAFGFCFPFKGSTLGEQFVCPHFRRAHLTNRIGNLAWLTEENMVPCTKQYLTFQNHPNNRQEGLNCPISSELGLRYVTNRQVS